MAQSQISHSKQLVSIYEYILAFSASYFLLRNQNTYFTGASSIKPVHITVLAGKVDRIGPNLREYEQEHENYTI